MFEDLILKCKNSIIQRLQKISQDQLNFMLESWDLSYLILDTCILSLLY